MGDKTAARYAIIEADQVMFYYGDNIALSNISINITQGQHVVILGANGSGKSTIAKHFNALLTPTNGDILVKKMNTKDANNTWEIRKSVGMVFQNPENQIIGATVEDDIIFGMENIGLSTEEIAKRLEQVIDMLQLQAIRTKEPYQLSGGQKQRVAIAGILAMEPDVIIFDEATSMLDPDGRNEVLKAIAALINEHSATIIHITHDIEEAIVADYVLIMSEGMLTTEGTPEQIFTYQSNLEAYGLQLPFSMQFYKLFLDAQADSSTVNYDTIPMNIDELVDALCK
jgi:energy-coupling factor transport system ATP-binding protein